MKLTEEQWRFIEPYVPKIKVRKDRRGRPWKNNRDVLEGILWILKTGARWKDLPQGRYPPYQTCHRRFQSWVKSKVMEKILRALVEHLKKKGKINLAETFIDASFVEAKKGAPKLAKPSLVRELRSWQSLTIRLFLSPYPLKVLHRMRVDLLKERFGKGIQRTFLCDLSETKLTIMMFWMPDLREDIESGLLLPTSQIGESHRLKMDELLEDTKEDGKLRDSLHGFNDLNG